MLNEEEYSFILQMEDEAKKHLPHIYQEKDLYKNKAFSKSYHILSHYNGFEICHLSGLDPEHESTLCFLKVHYSSRSGKFAYDGEDIQLVVTKKLDRDYGRIIIRPETLLDKVSEWFNPLEMDFKYHKKFSSKYYFLAEDKALGQQFATEHRLEMMFQMDKIQVETIDDRLIAKFSRPANQKDLLSLAKFIESI